MAVAMVVNGKLFKVAAAICGLLVTVYALYVYREVTAELQLCGKELTAVHQQHTSTQNVIKDLEEDARQARSSSADCQKAYNKLHEENAKKAVESEQNIKKLSTALDVERKAKDDVVAERDLLTSRCSSEAQTLRTQLDMAQKKCSEDKNQMQNRLDEVISHSDIVDKQQQICTDDKEKLANENEALKAQNGDLSSKLKALQQQVKNLLEKAKSPYDPKSPYVPKKVGSVPNTLPSLEKALATEKEKRGVNPLPLANRDTYSLRKTLEPMRPDGKFFPLDLQSLLKSDGYQKNPVVTTIVPTTPAAGHHGNLPPVQGDDKAADDDEDSAVDKPGMQLGTGKDGEEDESQQLAKQSEDNMAAGNQGLGMKQADVNEGGVARPKKGVANSLEGAPGENGNDDDDEGPDKPGKDTLADGFQQQKDDMKMGAEEKSGVRNHY